MKFGLTRRIKLILAGAFMVFSLFYLLVHILPVTRNVKATIEGILFLVIPIISVAGIFYAYLHLPRSIRSFWLFLGIAMSFLLTGETIWIYYEVFRGMNEAPYPSLADFAFLAAYPFFLFALLSMSRFSGSFASAKIKAFLDIFVVMNVILVATWFLLIRPYYAEELGVTFYEQVINGLYPIIDLAIVFGILINLFRSKVSQWKPWEMFVTGGLVLIAAADYAFIYFSAIGAYSPTNLLSGVLDIFWAGGYYLFFVGAVYALNEKQSLGETQPVETRVRWSDLIVPLVVISAVPLLLYYAQVSQLNSVDYWILVLSASALGVAIVLRSGTVMVESSRLFSSSVTDALTGLFNYRYFTERTDKELRRAKLNRENLSLAVINIDDFGRFNSIYGHFEGDKLLKEIGVVINSVLRASDRLCRIGGDEYALIMPATNSVEAYKVCLESQKALENIDTRESIKIAISVGISSYPIHGFDREELERKADGALYWAKFHGKSQVLVYDPDVVKTLNVQERVQRIEEESYLGTVRALAAAVDARDHYTEYHSEHVSSMAAAMASKMGFDKEKVNHVETAALLHDIGKIGIADGILRKKGRLTDEEWAKLEAHPSIGHKILSKAVFKEVLPWVLCHHERWDGSGYPQGLMGDQIPVESRILALCDSYDAMMSDRPYRKALGHDKAVIELRKGKGTQYDPSLVDVFIQLTEQTQEEEKKSA